MSKETKEADDMINILSTYGWVEIESCDDHYSVTLMYEEGGDSVSGTVGSLSLYSALEVIYQDITDDMLKEVGLN